jgi:uncharacterized protein YbaR (Trm112 family)
MITTELAALLSCPTCSTGGLQLTAREVEGKSILEGELNCESCDKLYPIRKGSPTCCPRAS